MQRKEKVLIKKTILNSFGGMTELCMCIKLKRNILVEGKRKEKQRKGEKKEREESSPRPISTTKYLFSILTFKNSQSNTSHQIEGRIIRVLIFDKSMHLVSRVSPFYRLLSSSSLLSKNKNTPYNVSQIQKLRRINI